MFDGEMIVPVAESNGKYWITSFGRLFRAPCQKRPNWAELNGEPNHGYVRAKLSLDSGVKRMRIHRLVADAFLSNPENKPAVNHIDGNKKNNKVENLEWCTHSENEHHSYRTLGKQHPKLLPKSISIEAIKLRNAGITIREVAERLGVSESFVKVHIRKSRDLETRIKRIKE